MYKIVCLAGAALFATAANAAVNVVVTQGEEADLAALYGPTDLIEGMIATELAGDLGWHPANTDPLDQLPAFTDGIGLRPTGLTGLLNDFPGAGLPTKRVQYDLPDPTNIGEIRIFSGNNGKDGRVFHTYTVEFSGDDGGSWSAPIYVQSHPSGTTNDGDWRVVLSQLMDSSGTLAFGVTNLRFDFYAVDNTSGQMRDPFDGVNPFTGVDDGLTAAFVSPLIWEIDVIPVPEPAGLALLALAGLLIRHRRRQTSLAVTRRPAPQGKAPQRWSSHGFPSGL
jgi:hypothetical protein